MLTFSNEREQIFCTQLNGFNYFQKFLLCIRTMLSLIWPIDRTLSSITTPSRVAHGGWECLVSYAGHSLWRDGLPLCRDAVVVFYGLTLMITFLKFSKFILFHWRFCSSVFLGLNAALIQRGILFRFIKIWGARGVVVIIVGNGHGDTSSNPGRDRLYFS